MACRGLPAAPAPLTPGVGHSITDIMAKQTKQRRRIIALLLITGLILLCVTWTFANRHRALVRQPWLFTKCVWSETRRQGSLADRWSRAANTVDYFWYSYRVHLDTYGQWHSLPMYRRSNIFVTYHETNDYGITLGEAAQPTSSGDVANRAAPEK